MNIHSFILILPTFFNMVWQSIISGLALVPEYQVFDFEHIPDVVKLPISNLNIQCAGAERFESLGISNSTDQSLNRSRFLSGF